MPTKCNYHSWCRKCGAGRDPDEAGPLSDRVWVIDITRYSDGTEEAYLECQNCGYCWFAKSGYSEYRKAPGFVVRDAGEVLNNGIGRLYKG